MGSLLHYRAPCNWRTDLLKYASKIFVCAHPLCHFATRSLMESTNHYLAKHIMVTEFGIVCDYCFDDMDDTYPSEHFMLTEHCKTMTQCPMCCYCNFKKDVKLHLLYKHCSFNFCHRCKGKCKFRLE